MNHVIDFTHDAALDCWVPGANGHPDFPIQNLPLGVFSPPGSTTRRVGVAIGDYIADLAVLAELLTGDARIAAREGSAPTVSGVLARGPQAVVALRRGLSGLLSDKAHEAKASSALYPAGGCTLSLPCHIGDYTDFYTGIRHAENVGRLLRPDNPLLPNYKHVPIGYHGRASSVRLTGQGVRRPSGQVLPAGEAAPVVRPTARLDYELEMAIWVGQGNDLGNPVPIARAGDCIGGMSLLNDWSARDIQAWEYQPLGPFLAKSFHSTISPWVVTLPALAPFRTGQRPRDAGDPALLPYLADQRDQAGGAFAITLETHLQTATMRTRGIMPIQLSRGSMTNMYWTAAQLIAHHTSNGCNLAPGDMLGTGTLSGDTEASLGSLMEITRGGARPLSLPTGETRTFLEDGDEIILSAYAQREGFVRIGFGECRAQILAAHEP